MQRRVQISDRDPKSPNEIVGTLVEVEGYMVSFGIMVFLFGAESRSLLGRERRPLAD